ncbi:hypothetical protein AGOR_G00028040 [Albula goreensis]|uniref:Secreted protein n=1 Tax=Albula goreensis TaxID=1534307 RepID=A0A8T3E4H1_9TELE|nr:hypothetical protein AGOR_G00028040 [Albula goreensis]
MGYVIAICWDWLACLCSPNCNSATPARLRLLNGGDATILAGNSYGKLTAFNSSGLAIPTVCLRYRRRELCLRFSFTIGNTDS